MTRLPERASSTVPNAMGFYPMQAVEWRVGPAPDLRAPHGLREVRIVQREQIDGTTLFGVKEGPWCANKSREWELEPLPSGRDDEFTKRCRWDDWEDAALVAQHMVKEMLAGERKVAGQ